MKSIIISVIIGSMIASTVDAVPAYPGTIVFEQKDGSTFEGKLKGDEYFNWVEDKAQHIILYNKKSKQYEYAKVVKSQTGKIDIAPSRIPVMTSPHSSTLHYVVPQVNIPKIDPKILYQIWQRKRSSKHIQ